MSEILAALLGALVAGLVPFFIGRRDRRRRREAILRAIAAEVLVICEFIRRNALPEFFAQAAELTDQGDQIGYYPLDAKYNYFTLFETMGNQLGDLNATLTGSIVRFYTQMKLILETSRTDSHFPPSAQNFRYLAGMSNSILSIGDEICTLAEKNRVDG